MLTGNWLCWFKKTEEQSKVIAAMLCGGLLLLAAASSDAATKNVVFKMKAGTQNAKFSVTATTPPSFHLVLRIRNDGTRAILHYRKSTWKDSRELMDTKTYGCDGAAGSLYCEASYEPLPKGTYLFSVSKQGRKPTQIEVTLKW